LFSVGFHFLCAGVLGSHGGGEVGFTFFHGEHVFVGGCGCGCGVLDGAADEVGGALGEDGVARGGGGEEGDEEEAWADHGLLIDAVVVLYLI